MICSCATQIILLKFGNQPVNPTAPSWNQSPWHPQLPETHITHRASEKAPPGVQNPDPSLNQGFGTWQDQYHPKYHLYNLWISLQPGPRGQGLLALGSWPSSDQIVCSSPRSWNWQSDMVCWKIPYLKKKKTLFIGDFPAIRVWWWGYPEWFRKRRATGLLSFHQPATSGERTSMISS